MSWITDVLRLLLNLLEGLKYEIESIRFQNRHDIISPTPIRYGITLKVTNASQLQLSIANVNLWVNDVEYRRNGGSLPLFVAGEVKSLFLSFACEETSPQNGQFRLILTDSRGRKKILKGEFPV